MWVYSRYCSIMALKNTCEALCFPVEKFAMGNTNLFFSRWGKKHCIACLLSYFEIISNVGQSCVKSTAYTLHPDHTTFVLSLLFLKHLRTGCRDQSPWAPEDTHERTRTVSHAFLYTIAVRLSNSKDLTETVIWITQKPVQESQQQQQQKESQQLPP